MTRVLPLAPTHRAPIDQAPLGTAHLLKRQCHERYGLMGNRPEEQGGSFRTPIGMPSQLDVFNKRPIDIVGPNRGIRRNSSVYLMESPFPEKRDESRTG